MCARRCVGVSRHSNAAEGRPQDSGVDSDDRLQAGGLILSDDHTLVSVETHPGVEAGGICHEVTVGQDTARSFSVIWRKNEYLYSLAGNFACLYAHTVERYVSAQIARPAIRGNEATLGEAMSGRDPDPDQLLTPSEVAALFRVDPKTVTRWAKAGKLTSIRTLGGHRRYRATEVHALLDSQSGSRGGETVAPDASHATPPGGFPPR